MTVSESTPTPIHSNDAADTATVTGWLPTIAQIRRAVQLDLAPEIIPAAPADAPQQPTLFDTPAPAVEARDPDAPPAEPAESPGDTAASAASAPMATVLLSFFPESHPLSISMRQGLGLIVVTALLAGLLPFAWSWYVAVRLDTIPPFIEAAQFAAQQAAGAVAPDSGLTALADTAGTLAGLQPQLPVWLAAGLTALGEWVNWPLRWLAIWIVYGLGVLAICVLFGATTTLQHFFAATSYAAVPLLLTGLAFIPILGALAVLVGWAWSAVVYAVAVRSITGLDTVRTVLSILAPAALFALLSFLAFVALVAFTLQFAL
jgi:hypothetical protein